MEDSNSHFDRLENSLFPNRVSTFPLKHETIRLCDQSKAMAAWHCIKWQGSCITFLWTKPRPAMSHCAKGEIPCRSHVT